MPEPTSTPTAPTTDPQTGPADTPTLTPPAPKPAATETATPTPPAPKPAPPKTPAPHANDDSPQSVEDLPEWARSEIARARGDAMKYRTRARDSVTEADALNARVAELETARRTAEISAIAARHGITDEDADLFFSPADDLSKVEKIAEALGQRRAGAVIPREGTGNATPGDNPDAAFAKALFNE